MTHLMTHQGGRGGHGDGGNDGCRGWDHRWWAGGGHGGRDGGHGDDRQDGLRGWGKHHRQDGLCGGLLGGGLDDWEDGHRLAGGDARGKHGLSGEHHLRGATGWVWKCLRHVQRLDVQGLCWVLQSEMDSKRRPVRVLL